MQYYSISRDINNHFSNFKQYKYGNNTFYNKKDYESFIKSINYEIKYKNVSNEISSKK